MHCGDLTMVGQMHEYAQTLEMLKGIDAELKLVIAGNHDISLDEEYYARKGQYMQRLQDPDEDMPRRARELWTGEMAKQAGVTYLDEGMHSFTLRNGATLRVCSPHGRGKCVLNLNRCTLRPTSPSSVIGRSRTFAIKTVTMRPTKARRVASQSPRIRFPTSLPST
jgi:hypothetical protein